MHSTNFQSTVLSFIHHTRPQQHQRMSERQPSSVTLPGTSNETSLYTLFHQWNFPRRLLTTWTRTTTKYLPRYHTFTAVAAFPAESLATPENAQSLCRDASAAFHDEHDWSHLQWGQNDISFSLLHTSPTTLHGISTGLRKQCIIISSTRETGHGINVIIISHREHIWFTTVTAFQQSVNRISFSLTAGRLHWASNSW